MIAELHSRCSERPSAAVPDHCQYLTYLTLKIHSSRACQVTIVICLLHRSCWLPAAQHCIGAIESLCMQKRRRWVYVEDLVNLWIGYA